MWSLLLEFEDTGPFNGGLDLVGGVTVIGTIAILLLWSITIRLAPDDEAVRNLSWIYQPRTIRDDDISEPFLSYRPNFLPDEVQDKIDSEKEKIYDRNGKPKLHPIKRHPVRLPGLESKNRTKSYPWDFFLYGKSVTDTSMLVRSGLQPILYLYFTQKLMIIMLIAAITSAITIPVTGTATRVYDDAVEEGEKFYSAFPEWTIRNLDDADPRFWAHGLTHMILSIVIMKICWDLKTLGIRLRGEFRKARGVYGSVQASTVLISGLPTSIGEPHQLIDFIEANWLPDSIICAHIIYEVPELVTAMKNLERCELEKTKQRNIYESIKSEYEDENDAPRPRGTPEEELHHGCMGCLCCICDAVTVGDKDLISHYESEIVSRNHEINKILQRPRHRPSGHAFVTFGYHSLAKQVIQNNQMRARPIAYVPDAYDYNFGGATNDGQIDIELGELGDGISDSKKESKHGSTAQITESAHQEYDSEEDNKPRKWTIVQAPPPTDLEWHSFFISAEGRLTRDILLNLTFWAFVCVGSLPSGILGSVTILATMKDLEEYFNPILELDNYMVAVVNSALPAGIIFVLFGAVPTIIHTLVQGQGFISKSEIDRNAMIKLFIFNFTAIIVGPSIIIGVIEEMEDFVQDVGSDYYKAIMNVITAVTVPYHTGFFACISLIYGLIGAALTVTRPVQLSVQKIKLLLIPELTPEEAEKLKDDENRMKARKMSYEDVYKVEPFPYFEKYARVLLLVALSLTFQVTMPITTSFGVFGLVLNYYADRYVLAYVHPNPPPSDSDGKMFGNAVQLLLGASVAANFWSGLSLFASGCVGQAFICMILFNLGGYEIKLIFDAFEKAYVEDGWIPDRGSVEKESDSDSKISTTLSADGLIKHDYHNAYAQRGFDKPGQEGWRRFLLPEELRGQTTDGRLDEKTQAAQETCIKQYFAQELKPKLSRILARWTGAAEDAFDDMDLKEPLKGIDDWNDPANNRKKNDHETEASRTTKGGKCQSCGRGGAGDREFSTRNGLGNESSGDDHLDELHDDDGIIKWHVSIGDDGMDDPVSRNRDSSLSRGHSFRRPQRTSRNSKVSDGSNGQKPWWSPSASARSRARSDKKTAKKKKKKKKTGKSHKKKRKKKQEDPPSSDESDY